MAQQKDLISWYENEESEESDTQAVHLPPQPPPLTPETPPPTRESRGDVLHLIKFLQESRTREEELRRREEKL
ncbi:hypothetical protein Pmani_006601 [Petrolisthes manimaculis]|uniref:Uncharacterized protein n=1 Tax=Petrolisthes manimaculis TaxID=1843537 RepID=A0AAE1ULL0_9EUCA|nr:hypothetical protein Pmani_006601 [Petrolisthes manimaculis]